MHVLYLYEQCQTEKGNGRSLKINVGSMFNSIVHNGLCNYLKRTLFPMKQTFSTYFLAPGFCATT